MLISELERMKNDNINKNKIRHLAFRSLEKRLTRGKRAQKI
jgi:hypothetical protein